MEHRPRPSRALPPAPARAIVTVCAGTHLYGTATPASDLDLKSVVLPAGRDVLLGRVRPTVATRRRWAPDEDEGGGPDDGRRPGDADLEAHDLRRFLDLLAAGQPLAVEMLFAPDDALVGPPDPLWREVQALGPRLLTRQTGVFLRYARAQAALHGARGERAAAARSALATLAAAEAAHGKRARLERAAAELEALAAATPHVSLRDVAVGEGRVVRHLEVCGRGAPFTAAIGAARVTAERLVAGYGRRTLEAERQGGVDWKALSHAVRVGREAVELLSTGRLRFPLADAARLLAIKLGRVPLAAMTDEIEALPGEVERAAARSALPDAPDLLAAEELVVRAYRAQVLGGAA